MKKWDLSKSPFLCSEQQLAAPHGNASLWQCLLSMQPYLSRGFCRVGRVLEPSYPLQRRKGKDGEIALWNTVFQDLLNYFTLRHFIVLNTDEHCSCCQSPDRTPPAADLAAGLRAGASPWTQGLLHPCCPPCASLGLSSPPCLWPWIPSLCLISQIPLQTAKAMALKRGRCW